MNLTYKIDYGTKPKSTGLVFPNHTREEIKKIYEDFYRTTYDKSFFKLISKEDFEQNKTSVEEIDKVISNSYTPKPNFFDIFPLDKHAKLEYLSAMDMFVPYGKDASILEDITRQFVLYLWKQEIPVAQHLAMKLDDEKVEKLERLEQFYSEQEE